MYRLSLSHASAFFLVARSASCSEDSFYVSEMLLEPSCTSFILVMHSCSIQYMYWRHTYSCSCSCAIALLQFFHVHHALHGFLYFRRWSFSNVFSSWIISHASPKSSFRHTTPWVWEEMLMYIKHFHGQDTSQILGVQTKRFTCITLILILVNVWLV